MSVSDFPSRYSLSGRFLSVSSVSGSLPSDYEPPYELPVEDCVACRDTVAPIQYDVFWDYNGVPATGFYDNKECCGQYSAFKTIRVKRIAAPRPGFVIENNCVWVSDLPALSSRMDFTGSFIPQRGCDTPVVMPQNVTRPRVTIAIPGAQILGVTTFDDPAVIIRYSHEIKLFNGQLLPQPSIFYAFYYYSPVNGENWREVGVRCLEPMRFKLSTPGNGPIVKRWENTFFEPRWGGGVWYGAPCKQSAFGGLDLGLPDYVTVTPVAA